MLGFLLHLCLGVQFRKFIPGTTNVQEYAQKLRFLAAMWPEEHLELLAPRAALHIEGTAFRKVSKLDPNKLKVKDVSGIALLVNTIGGSWGSTELEERYEFFEKALYGTVQKADESHDSYLVSDGKQLHGAHQSQHQAGRGAGLCVASPVNTTRR